MTSFWNDALKSTKLLLLFATLALTVSASAIAQTPDQDPRLRAFYQPSDGQVFIDIRASDLSIFTLFSVMDDSSPSDLLIPGNVETSSALGARYAGGNPSQISYDGGIFNGEARPLPMGYFAIGPVLLSGLDLTLIDSGNGQSASQAFFNGQNRGRLILNFLGEVPQGGGTRPQQFRGLTVLQAIPEPSSAALLVLGMAGAMLRRKKR